MDGSGSLPGFGGSLAISLLSLGFVCVIAYVALRFLGRRGLGRSNGPIRIMARLPLEPRRALYVVEAGGRCFLIGVGDGPMTMLAELGVDDMKVPLPEATEAGARFAEVLGKVLGNRRPGAGPT